MSTHHPRPFCSCLLRRIAIYLAYISHEDNPKHNAARRSRPPRSACSLALPAYSATFTLNPSLDAFVTTGPSGNLSGNNYGGAGALSVAAPGLAKGEFQSVLQFDLSGARTSFNAQFGAGQWSIQSITLTLTATSPNNAIFNSSAAGQFGISWMQNDSWVEGTGTPNAPTTTGITYSSLPSFTGAGDESLGTFSFNGAPVGSVTYTLSLTPGFPPMPQRATLSASASSPPTAPSATCLTPQLRHRLGPPGPVRCRRSRARGALPARSRRRCAVRRKASPQDYQE